LRDKAVGALQRRHGRGPAQLEGALAS